MNSFESIVINHLRKHGYESAPVKAALIDMDGTLYDSMPGHSRAWERLAREEGIATEPGEFFMHEGRTGAATINLLFNRRFGRDATEQEVKDLYHRKTVYFSEMPLPPKMPGAADMLTTLMDSGIKRVLVTGSGQSSLINRLSIDYPGAFAPDMRITSRDVTHGKPHPEPYLMAMKLAGVEPRNAMVIENAPLGVAAGAASGAFTVAVVTGPIPAEEMVRAGASIVFPSMAEMARALPELLSSLNSVRATHNS